jgi:uncharacterized membrane protein
MSDVIETVDVAVPVRTAYNQWTQFEEFPRFMEGVEKIEQVSDTLTHWKIKIGGIEREFDAEITEQRPDERVAWNSVGGTDHAGVVTFHRLDDVHTRVTLQLDTTPEGLVETLGDKLGFVKRRAKGDMERFKDFIESQGLESGGYREEVQPSGQTSGAAPTAGGATGDVGAAGGVGSAGGIGAAGSVSPNPDPDTYVGVTDVDPTLGGGSAGGTPPLP